MVMLGLLGLAGLQPQVFTALLKLAPIMTT